MPEIRCRVCGRFIREGEGVENSGGYICRSCAEKLSKKATKNTRIPFEEFRCPKCGAIVMGDLAIIDHYLEHREVLKVAKGVELRDLSDYRSLDPDLKLKAYKKAKRFFRRTS